LLFFFQKSKSLLFFADQNFGEKKKRGQKKDLAFFIGKNSSPIKKER
jgi:hypothetical protein